MVTEAVVTLLVSMWNWILAVVPAPAAPSWFSDAEAGIDAIDETLSSMSVWIPVGLLSSIVTLWAATLAAGWTIKLIRIVASFFTAGGGSAA